jgi:hypothetical protein
MVLARITRNRTGAECDRDVYVARPSDPSARQPWSGEFWTPIADKYEPGEEVFIRFTDGRAAHAMVYRIEIDARITTNCRIEITGTSPIR